jgi:hypothetical protein
MCCILLLIKQSEQIGAVHPVLNTAADSSVRMNFEHHTQRVLGIQVRDFQATISRETKEQCRERGTGCRMCCWPASAAAD